MKKTTFLFRSALVVAISIVSVVCFVYTQDVQNKNDAEKKVKYSKIPGKKIEVTNKGEFQEKYVKGKSRGTYIIKKVYIDPSAKELISKESSYVLFVSINKNQRLRVYFDPASVPGRGKFFRLKSQWVLEFDESHNLVDFYEKVEKKKN